MVLLVAGTLSADVVFGPDTGMGTANWYAGPSAKVAAGVNIDTEWAVSDVTDASLGNAVQLSVQFDMSGSNSKWLAGTVFRSDWTYNPSVSGALTSFAFAGDFTANYGNSMRIALQQGGNTFWTTVAPAEGFTTILNSGITSASYAVLDASNFADFGTDTGTLDFSETGGEITFGYAIRYGSTAAFNNRILEVNANNASFTLSTVPEPATLGLVSLAAIGLLGVRRLGM
jgi:hypothetical protein